VREARPDTPPPLARLVMSCLQKDPAARPQAASDLVRALESVSSGEVVVPPTAQTKLVRALAIWGGSTVVVALAAWAATSVIGLPDWVLPGSLAVMAAGLPAIAATWFVQRTTRRVYATTAVITPGQVQSHHGTLASMAVRANPHVSWRRTMLGGAAAVGAFAVLVAVFMTMRAFGIGPAASLIGSGKFDREERIIITDFKSPVGDSTVGLTVTEALRADLAGSSVLHVVPRATITDALRVSQRPATTAVDFAIAREIATRDGVKAVLDGEVISLGDRFKVAARLVSATTGEVLAGFQVEADDANDLIRAIGRLGKQLRAKAGEPLKAVREATSVEKVTTSSMEALSKYMAALATYDRTGDQVRAISLLKEATEIDSMFAMAWRRLGSHYSNVGRLELASAAVARAYDLRERLVGVERYLTDAAYFTYGPKSDQERALDAYEAVLAIDSLNIVANNNAAGFLAYRRDFDRAATYRRRAIMGAGGGANSAALGNLVGDLANAGRLREVDSIARVWAELAPNQPTRLLYDGRIAAYVQGNLPRADSLYRVLMKAAPESRTVIESALNELGSVSFARGRLREGFQHRAEVARRSSARGQRDGSVFAWLDSALFTALVLENPSAALTVLARPSQRARFDSIAFIDRPYFDLLMAATFVGDSAFARRTRADYQRWFEQRGKVVYRAADEALADGLAEFAAGRHERALAKFAEADQLREPWAELCLMGRFLAFDRLGQADSAIAAGNAYLTTRPRFEQSFMLYSAMFRPNILQRVGELYEAKAMPDSAIARYQSMLDYWKDADPELQPRLRDVRGRVSRLRAAVGKG
jgi:tetratricopeptide (TPR) repeat protein